MSENIDYFEMIVRATKWAGTQNVDSLRQFLMQESDVPLIAVGAGGSLSVASYATLLYGTGSAMGRALSPLSVNSLSDTSLLRCKVLLVSASGHNKDINYIADRLTAMKHPRVANLSIKDGDNNELRKKVAPACSFNYTSDFSNEFVEFESVVAQYSILCKAFGCELPDLDIQNPYTYSCSDDRYDAIPLSQVRHLVVLYADYAEPVAVDLESKMVESGLVCAQLCDYRNFCHGRFAFVANHVGNEQDYKNNADTAVVILSTPHLHSVAERLKTILPKWCPIVTIETVEHGPAAGFDLLAKASLFFIYMAHEKGLNNPLNPRCPNIDKRVPQNKVTFKKDLKKQGPLNMTNE